MHINGQHCCWRYERIKRQSHALSDSNLHVYSNIYSSNIVLRVACKLHFNENQRIRDRLLHILFHKVSSTCADNKGPSGPIFVNLCNFGWCLFVLILLHFVFYCDVGLLLLLLCFYLCMNCAAICRNTEWLKSAGNYTYLPRVLNHPSSLSCNKLVQITNQMTCHRRCIEKYLFPLLHAELQERQDECADQQYETQSQRPARDSLPARCKHNSSWQDNCCNYCK